MKVRDLINIYKSNADEIETSGGLPTLVELNGFIRLVYPDGKVESIYVDDTLEDLKDILS